MNTETETAVMYHLGVGGVTLCGAVIRSGMLRHPSKAKKTDCEACRTKLRETKAKKPIFKETSLDTKPAPVPEPVIELPTPTAPTEVSLKELFGRWQVSEEDVRQVLRLRAEINEKGMPMPYMQIEERMGWKDTHGNRAHRIVKRAQGKWGA